MNFWLFLKVKWFLYREKKQVRRLFPSFTPFDRALKRAYRFHNPYHLCRRRQTVYGETPIPVFARIAEVCGIHSEDIVFEIGCGRGRGALFLSHLCNCQVIGIDWIPFFIRMANGVAGKAPLRTTFLCEDMHSVDYSKATVIYLYGTCLSDEEIVSMAALFEKLPSRTKIVTVSYPLSEYSRRFHVVDQFTGEFPWGEGEIYINKTIC
jgi:SAM-dependent methyltransferase